MAIYLPLDDPPTEALATDLSRENHDVRFFPQNHRRRQTRLPNGDLATDFDGLNEYGEVQSDTALSIATTGKLSIEAWIRPDTLQFRKQEGDGYVNWMGKGEPHEYEYAGRIYSLVNAASRPNRISGYAHNLTGGLGSGSYFQDRLAKYAWIHVAIIVNMQNTSAKYKTGYVRIYKRPDSDASAADANPFSMSSRAIRKNSPVVFPDNKATYA